MNRRVLKHFFSLLHVDYVKLNQKWNYTNVISPYYRLYYIDDGKGYVSNARGTLQLEAGNLYLIPSYTLCNLNCPDHLSQYFIHFFEESSDGISLFHNHRMIMKVQANETDVANIKRILEMNPGRGINRSDNPKVYEKNVYYKGYQELNNMQSIAVYMETQGIIFQLISRFLSSNRFKQKSTGAIPSKILDAIGYIQVNLNKDLTVAHLAERANQNMDYFSRQFLHSTGIRPLAYIHEKRIERAQYLIITTSMPYAEIAAETGFETLQYFSRIFKKVTSLTPGQYRQQHQYT